MRACVGARVGVGCGRAKQRFQCGFVQSLSSSHVRLDPQSGTGWTWDTDESYNGTVALDGTVPDDKIKMLIDMSYHLTDKKIKPTKLTE